MKVIVTIKKYYTVIIVLIGMLLPIVVAFNIVEKTIIGALLLIGVAISNIYFVVVKDDKPESSNTKIVRLGATMLIWVVVLGSLKGVSNSESRKMNDVTENNPVSSQPIIQVPEKKIDTLVIGKGTVKELYDYYDANEIVADDKLRGKYVAVVGYVESVSRTFGNVYVKLNDGSRYSNESVDCIVSEADARRVAKGNLITVIGVCNGMGFMSVNLVDAAVIEVYQQQMKR